MYQENDTFRTGPQSTEQCRIHDLDDGQWDTPALRTAVNAILPEDQTIRDFDVTHTFPRVGNKSLADITYIATWEGFLYLAVVLDVFSRKVVGWAMRSHLLSELVLSALDMALTVRRPHDVIHHSDQGTQYTSVAFGARCEALGVRASMGSVGDCYDNAMCESFFATLECELLERYRFRTKAEAEAAVFQFIEGWYNPHRLHSSLGYVSPVNYERAYHQNAASRA